MDIYTVSLIPGLCLVSFCVGVLVSIPLTYSCVTQGVKTYEKSSNTEECVDQVEETSEQEGEQESDQDESYSSDEYESPSESPELWITCNTSTTLKITFDNENNRTVVEVKTEDQDDVPEQCCDDEDEYDDQHCSEEDIQIVNELDKKQK
jgi:hypothetical protein